jgi:hypothetical protein
MSYYLLQITPQNYYVYNNFLDIKKVIVESLLDIQSFIHDLEICLYIVCNNQLVLKCNVKSWVHIVIEDIYIVNFNPNLIEIFFTTDEDDREIIQNLNQMLSIKETLVSSDLSKVQLITELNNSNIDGFDMIQIDINYQQLPDTQFNINSSINFPKNWQELTPKMSYTYDDDVILLSYGCNKNGFLFFISTRLS